jgi:hypothetical protein
MLVEAFVAINNRSAEYIRNASVDKMPKALQRLHIEPGLKGTITKYAIQEWQIQRDKLDLYDVVGADGHFEVVHKSASV